MLLEVLATANSPRVLVALKSLGGAARFTDIRNTANLGDTQTSRALKDLNKRGLVAAKPQSDRSMRYSITKGGTEVVELLMEFHGLVHSRSGPVARSADKEFESILVL
jgi:DNA-binding HxlR family transcriptional regulator